MTNIKKRPIFSLVLLLLVLVCVFSIVAIPASAFEIMPYYNNAISAKSSAQVSSTGVLTIYNGYTGISGV